MTTLVIVLLVLFLLGGGGGVGIFSLAPVAAKRNCHVIWDLHRRLLDINRRINLWSRDTSCRRALDRSGRNRTLGPCDSEGRSSDTGKRSVVMRRNMKTFKSCLVLLAVAVVGALVGGRKSTRLN